MSRIACFIGMFLMIATVSTVSADDQNSRQRGKAGQDRQRDARNRPQIDLATMVPKMLEKFDSDGDSKLDVQELTAFFKMLQERRGQMFRGGEMMQRRGAGKPGAKAAAGGEKPKRPKRDQ